MTNEQTTIAVFIGTIVGTAASIVVARLLMDPRVRALEDKIDMVIDMLIKQIPPK